MGKHKRKLLKWIETDRGCFQVIDRWVDKDGYSFVSAGRTEHGKYPKYRSHRFIYEECFGKIPEGVLVRHKCDNPACVNPEHLELGTHADNMKDMSKRGRHSSHGRHTTGNAKLNMNIARQIRKDWGDHEMNIKQLSKKYGVSPSSIGRVIHNEAWKEGAVE
ncbi:hypothetical protein BpsS140_00049 [Bacillus phage vB_BpsS-140]|nr:hypothetical protein BpsS140_00049 [Bacillus phage vB_BpsS-140]